MAISEWITSASENPLVLMDSGQPPKLKYMCVAKVQNKINTMRLGTVPKIIDVFFILFLDLNTFVGVIDRERVLNLQNQTDSLIRVRRAW